MDVMNEHNTNGGYEFATVYHRPGRHTRDSSEQRLIPPGRSMLFPTETSFLPSAPERIIRQTSYGYSESFPVFPPGSTLQMQAYGPQPAATGLQGVDHGVMHTSNAWGEHDTFVPAAYQPPL